MLLFYDEHYPKYPNGTLWLKDAQALETWPNCTNPTPQVAALHRICEGLLALPTALVSNASRAFFSRVCTGNGLPDIPRTGGGLLLSPCEGGFPTQHVNSENVEMYAVWPYELFAVNRTTQPKWPLEVGVASFNAVHFGHGNTAWRYDGQDAAVLGMASYALSMIQARVLTQGTTENSSFPGYLARDFADGAPQLESNGIVSVTLQKMLMQVEGRRIMLFPAWLRSFDVDAKLHFPAGPGGALPGTLHVVLVSGELKVLEVEPSSRKGDVVVLPLQVAPGPPPPPPPPPSPPSPPCVPPKVGPAFVQHPGRIGRHFLNGDFECSTTQACPSEAEAACSAVTACRSFGIDPAWKGNFTAAAQLYTGGLADSVGNPAWTLWERVCKNSS